MDGLSLFLNAMRVPPKSRASLDSWVYAQGTR